MSIQNKVLAILHVVAVIFFGYTFISVMLEHGPTQDPVEWWWNTIWAVGAMCIGFWGAVFTQKSLDSNTRGFEKLYTKTHFILFKKQAEGMQKPYMFAFSRAMGATFFIIGLVMFIQNLSVVFK